MGNLQMKLVVSIANLTKNCKSSKKQVVMSCVSLFLATIILISSAYCWLFLQEAKTLGTFSVDAGNGLRLNYNNNNSNVVQITDNMKFLPVSSVNGQNLYFPSDGSFYTKSSLQERTEEVKYRSATAGDKNIYFLQFDFALTSYTDGTEVFIDETDTYIKTKDKTKNSNPGVPLKAMRVAFLYDNGKNTVVMNPTGKERSVKAVDLVNFGTGECLKTSTQISKPFSYYTSTNAQSLFTLAAGETQTMSVVVWLEGTDKDCVNDIIVNNLDINIKFTTTWNNMDEIKFKDVSSDKWISKLLKSGSQLQLVYKDAQNIETTYDMVGSGEEFTCKLPKTIDNGLYFKLTVGETVYKWDTEPDGTPSTYRGKNVTYYAKGTKADPRGYWKTSDSDNDIDVDVPDEEW